MSSNPDVFSSPIFWIYLAGVFSGAALSELTVISRRTRDPIKTRRRKPTKIFLSLAASIAFGTVAALKFLPDVNDPRNLLLAYGGASLLSALGFRFKRAAGVPLLLILVFVFIAGRQGFSSWKPYYPAETLGTLRVLGVGDDGLSISVLLAESEERLLEVKSRGFGLRGEILETSDFFIPLAPKRSFRPLSLLEDDLGIVSLLPRDGPGFFAAVVTYLPGVQRTVVEARVRHPKLFSTYHLVIDADDGLSFHEM
jgi:hypothetical protein